MPKLIGFMITHMTVGFLIGTLAAIALVLLHPAEPEGLQPLALWLKIFALGGPFALGSLATALMLDAES
ncbi:hypothetical protein [Sinorhizobium alkalisoli]|uniref:Uncharacterized protein n=1 Tax=Sinorhizobium alkalisoli TaxID=1752398 RepID=A0A1E3VH39_9HYPH|nr:hypothetical protein [Sinorhizobium alkalisoli]MCG5480291.1 hypothetical protein [Sinorhizobium alkalisoli]ODR92441.1 hypothetical protein A8M32_05260 [Sinorhizobium alkalisoli]